MLLRELIIQLQDLQEDGYGDKEVFLEGCDYWERAFDVVQVKRDLLPIILITRDKNA